MNVTYQCSLCGKIVERPTSDPKPEGGPCEFDSRTSHSWMARHRRQQHQWGEARPLAEGAHLHPDSKPKT